MQDVAIMGSGAFGTALAIALSTGGKRVVLWGRSSDAVDTMARTRFNPKLPEIEIPETVTITSDQSLLAGSSPLLMVTPTQTLRSVLSALPFDTRGRAIVACCKGIDLETHTGPSSVISQVLPDAVPAVLTGPSFAIDIARGLPTALTLACADKARGMALQTALSRQTLRLYLSEDVVGAELGGALKNIVAIACGICMGAGLGVSARAAIMTRGFAEMQRLAAHFNASPATLTGLSGFGDLTLTCTSEQSRNYRFGMALGRNEIFDSATTVEGVSTARAVNELAADIGLDLPIAAAVHGIASGETSVAQVLQTLLSRPLKTE